MDIKIAERLLEDLSNSSGTKELVINSIHDTHFQEWQPLLETASKQHEKGFENLSLKIVEIIASETVCQGEAAEVNSAEYNEKFSRILTVTCSNKNFMHALEEVVSCWSREPEKHELLGSKLILFHRFCSDVLQRIPFLGKDVLLKLICVCIGVIASTSDINVAHPSLLEQYSDLQRNIQQLSKLFEEEKKVKSKDLSEQQHELLLHSLEPPDDYREIPIIPTMFELINEKRPFLRPNKVVGSYRNTEHYLDVQFRLLREDFVRPLRRAVQEFVKNRDEYIESDGKKGSREQGIRLYNDITFRCADKSKAGSTDYLFNLPEELVRKVNWNKSKRLLPGCLVMLTHDYCRSAIFAITLLPPFNPNQKKGGGGDSRRQELSNGILRLSIETGSELLDECKSYLMFECEAFFEAYRYNLGILQSMRFLRDMEPRRGIHDFRLVNYNREPHSLHKFIVKASAAVELPNYFTNPEIKLRLKDFVSVSPFDLETWPSDLIQIRMSLNPDQYHALKTALTSELAVIQGPPGTGKTYVGLQIVKTLLSNKNREAIPQSPLLILCYTNHALDQFLELLVQQIPELNVVRVGGQSKSEVLEAHTLAQHRKRLQEKMKSRLYYEDPWLLGPLGIHKREEGAAYRRMKQVEGLLEKVNSEINELTNPNGIIRFDRLLIGARLKSILPYPLWEIMTSPVWLGVTEDKFLIPNFRATEVIPQLFRIRPKTAAPTSNYTFDKAEANVMTQKINGKPRNDLKPEEFEYDMNELLEHRVEEDFDDIFYSWNTQGESVNMEYYYIPLCSSYQCKYLAEERRRRLEHVYRYYNSLTETLLKTDELKDLPLGLIYSNLLADVEKITKEIREYENRASLFSMIFGLHKEGRLESPNVHHVFRMAADGENYVIQNWNVIKYPIQLKWGIYFEVVRIALDLALEYREEVEEWLEYQREEYNEMKNELDVCILRNSDVIGMTTTGAAKMHTLLERARPKIVIVEEAAEILEAHIVTALTEDCKQLILIGDHLQLRPSANVYELWKKYKLNVSLFERMVLNDIPLCTLKTQHRMHPEISNLIIGPIYEELQDHASVCAYPHVKGVRKNMFFITHTELEDTDDDLLSKSNQHEVNFVLGLCQYLLEQGYQHEQITILTTYTGQMFLLKKQLSSSCKGVRVTSVDNFQGEENDIILLSLVRSNDDDNVGFVGIDNRICVALSRARHGLFVIGNMDGMKSASGTWKSIHKKLEERDNIGQALDLICERHEKATAVKNGNDFVPLLNGGCGQKCGAILECSHVCTRVCHPDDLEHEDYDCYEKCLKTCDDNHPCESTCMNECPPCMFPVLKTMASCGHQESIPCYQDISTVKCKVLVTKQFHCEGQHEQEIECYQMGDALACKTAVEKILPCGHVRMVECGISPEDVKCDIKEEKMLNCGHFRTLKCHQSVDDIMCNVEVEKALPCRHKKKLKCCVAVTGISCNAPVEVLMEGCLHVQRLPCSQSGDKECKQNCGQILPCGHKCPLKCHINEDQDHSQYKCDRKCERLCASGHLCRYNHKCFLKCLPCQVKVNISLDCGHEVNLECSKNVEEYKCIERVKRTLPCGHEQFVLCHVQPQEHICTTQVTECKEECEFGHSCSFTHACHEGCPPCEKKLEKSLKCGHRALLCCYVNGDSHECTEVVKQEIDADCGHVKKIECRMLSDELEDTIFTCSTRVRVPCNRCYKMVSIECCERIRHTLCAACKRRVEATVASLAASTVYRGWRRRRNYNNDDYMSDDDFDDYF